MIKFDLIIQKESVLVREEAAKKRKNRNIVFERERKKAVYLILRMQQERNFKKISFLKVIRDYYC